MPLYMSSSYIHTNAERFFLKSFARKDLPKEHRVIEHGSMVSQDYKPDRLVVDGKLVSSF